MTPEERKAAAEVMASEGPWDARSKLTTAPQWFPDDKPSWNWDAYEFRVRPKPIVRYVNFYAHTTITSYTQHLTRESADAHAFDSRIACVRVPFIPGQFDE